MTSNIHTPSLGRRLVSAIAILVTTVLGLATVTGAAGASAETGAEAKPTIVLVHGGWADSSGWNAEVDSLHEQGYPVVAPANPLRGLESDAAYLRSVLTTIDGPIVLVGHSYGGAVITNSAVGIPNVVALVYIAGFAPDTGESLVQLVTMNPGSEIGPDTLIPRPYPLPGGGEGTDLYLTPEGFRTAFAGDVAPEIADQMQATQRPFSQEAFESVSGEPAWTTIPSWYLVATEDKAIPPATHQFLAERTAATETEVEASHVPMISQPDATTDLILQAAMAVS